MSVGVEKLAGQARRQIAATLSAVKAHRGLTDDDIGHRIGRTGQSVSAYMTGRTGINGEMMVLLARALGIEAQVLFLTPNEAIQWILDNQPEPLPRARAGRRTPPRSTRWNIARTIGRNFDRAA